MKSLLHVFVLLTVLLPNAASANAAAPSSPVPFSKALEEAQKLASLDARWSVLRCDGDSMTPYFGPASLMIVQSASASELRPGMIAVYRDSENDLVAHSVVSVGEAGATLRGFNNARNDPDTVTDANLVGVVFGLIHSNGAGSGEVPVAMGKRM